MRVPEAEVAAGVIREVGIDRLCFFSGCVCSSCSIQGIDISISCWKSGSNDLPRAPLPDNPEHEAGQILVVISRISEEGVSESDLSVVVDAVRESLNKQIGNAIFFKIELR